MNSTANLLSTDKYQQLMQRKTFDNSNREADKPAPTAGLSGNIKIYEPTAETPRLVIRPTAPSWPELQALLAPIINLAGLWVTVGQLYQQGYGAELVTIAEIAIARHRKGQANNYFAASISKKSGNWAVKTLKKVHETWEVRRHALEVAERLQLEDKYTLKVVALAWKLKSSIIRYLGLALEQGAGIKNPAGVFFALTRQALQPSA